MAGYGAGAVQGTLAGALFRTLCDVAGVVSGALVVGRPRERIGDAGLDRRQLKCGYQRAQAAHGALAVERRGVFGPVQAQEGGEAKTIFHFALTQMRG